MHRFATVEALVIRSPVEKYQSKDARQVVDHPANDAVIRGTWMTGIVVSRGITVSVAFLKYTR